MLYSSTTDIMDDREFPWQIFEPRLFYWNIFPILQSILTLPHMSDFEQLHAWGRALCASPYFLSMFYYC